MPLKVSGISRRFRQNWALKDVSFEFDEGRVFGIFGPSGSGKTTLARIIAGSDKSHTGTYGFTCPDNSAPIGPAAVKYLSSSDQPTFLERLGFATGQGGSDGGRQVSQVQQALRSDAKVLILDACFSHLGEMEKTAAFDEIREAVGTTRKTIVYLSSDFNDIIYLCDQAAAISSGAVLQVDTPERIYLEPATGEVAALTGRNNIFEARRLNSSKAETHEFQTIQGSHRLIVGKVDRSLLGPLNQNMLLAIRPEHISISFGASFPEDNLLKAVITKVRFLGAVTLVHLDAGGLSVTALVMRLVGLKPGDECLLGMPPDRLQVFKR
jgi:ABC-type Fe3+/spermidine/putrescine transport system ATPase subunit